MNEAGLVVLSLGLDDTEFPKPDSRPAIDENGWMQYQLDNSASLVEVLESMVETSAGSRYLPGNSDTQADSQRGRESDPQPGNGLSAALQGPGTREVRFKPGERRLAFDLEVKLSSPAPRDLSFALMVPDESVLLPGRNVFLAPNPVTVGRGSNSAQATVIVLREAADKPLASELVIRLFSDEIPVQNGDRLSIQVCSDAIQEETYDRVGGYAAVVGSGLRTAGSGDR